MNTIILGIESSCDETAASVVVDGCRMLSNAVSSSEAFHREYGGIVPEIASRKQLEYLEPVFAAALDSAGVAPSELSAVAVTHGPGPDPQLDDVKTALRWAPSTSWANPWTLTS